MDERIYTVTLEDGTQLTGLRKNGGNFVSTYPVNPEIFEYNTSKVTVQVESETIIYENMELLQITKMGDEYWFALVEVPADKLAMREMQAQIDYISMMTGIE